MYRANLVNLRKGEALLIELKQAGVQTSVLVTPGESVPVIADSLDTVQIGSLVARQWLRIDQQATVVEHPESST